MSTVRYPRSCLPGEVQGRSGVLLKLIFLAVARLLLLFLLHATGVHFLSVRLCVLHAEVHRLLLFGPERPQERQILIVRDLDRARSRTSVSFAGLAVDLAALSVLLASLRRRRSRSRADAFAGRARQAGRHLRWAHLIHVRYDEALLEREERRVQQLHVRERWVKQRRAPPHGEPRNLGPEHLVRCPREIGWPQNRFLAASRRDVGRSQLHRDIRWPERAVLPLGQSIRMVMVVQMMMVAVRRSGRRGDDTTDAGVTGVLGIVIVVVIRGVQRAERLLVRGLGIFDQAILRLLGLLLQ